MKTSSVASIVIALVTASFLLLAGPSAFADDGTREAGKHFQRGVALYGEADYRAALVEFKRAYAVAPNAAVLYNVGETEYQLQDYASALATFERFLADASSSDPHRNEVESNVEILRSRVGHLSIATAPAGADVSVDDQPLGKTPLERAVLVSIGRRKVVATMNGRPPVTRYVDVAADDNVSVVVQLPAAADAAPSSSPAPQLQISHADPPAPSNTGATLRTLGWITTGATAAGAITFGALALKESNDLKTARASYPTSAATLSHDSSMTTTFSTVADSLAAAAILVGGVTLFSTLTSSPSASPKRGQNPPSPAVQVDVGLASAHLQMTF